MGNAADVSKCSQEIKNQTTEELVEIITNERFDYYDYALNAAEKELENRGVAVEEVKLEFEKSTKGFGKRINLYLIRRNDRRAKSTILFLGIIFVVTAFLLIFQIHYHKLLQSSLDPGSNLTLNQVALSDGLVSSFTVLSGLVELILGILFISWFRRLYYNLHLIFNQLSYKEGWAAGCWFVPVLCFFRPYVIMKEIWQTLSDFLSSKESETSESWSMIGLWWGLFIVRNFLEVWSNVTTSMTPDISDLSFSNRLKIIYSILVLVSVPVTVILLKQISKREQRTYELVRQILAN